MFSDRRRFLIFLGLASAGIGGCDRANSGRDHTASDRLDGYRSLNTDIPKIAPFSSRRLHELLDELRNAYEDKGLQVSRTLLPPIEESQLRSMCDWYPDELPMELVSLYGWRGGQEPGPWELDDADHPFWFRDCAFSSIDTARVEYQSMMETYGANPEDHDLLKYSFPFAAFNGGWMIIPTRKQNLDRRFDRPIIFVLQGIMVFFYSIELMVATCIDWVRHPSYDESGGLTNSVEKEIWRRHNPGIFESQ